MTIYARAAAFVDQRDGAWSGGAYQLGKAYELVPAELSWANCDFTIIDDEGDPLPCWWDGSDPDVIWEKVLVA